jgi:hypothetical protein
MLEPQRQTTPTTLVKLTVVMATQIWRARADRPALCLHNDTSIGREWIRQPVMAIVSLKGAIRGGGLAVGRQLINTSRAQILFALKTADMLQVNVAVNS